jgi:two-component system, LytTR family, sensor kinase
MFADATEILAVAAEACDAFRTGEPLPTWLVHRRKDRLPVEPRLTERARGLRFDSAVVVPLVVRGSRVGNLIALYRTDQRLQPEDTRAASETGALIAAKLKLAEIEAQNQRLALAELRALRAQISPQFMYDALAAVAALMRRNPPKRASCWPSLHTSYGMRFEGSKPCVTVADELPYIDKGLRLAQATLSDRLEVRVIVAAEWSRCCRVRPLVEDAVRHRVETTHETCRIEILGADLNSDVEMYVRDDGPGMSPDATRRPLDGHSRGIGLANLYRRLQNPVGPRCRLPVESRADRVTAVRTTVPKCHAEVRTS